MRTIFLLFFLFATHSYGDSTKQIAALLSQDVDAYTQAWTEFRLLVGRAHPDVRFLDFVVNSSNSADVFARIRSQGVDLLFAPGSDAAQLALQNIKTTPVISLTLTPGKFRRGNTAALSLEVPPAEKIARLHKLLPHLRRIGVIYSSNSLSDYNLLASACAAHGLRIVSRRIEDPKDFSRALENIAGRMDCFVMVTDPSIYFYQSVDYLLHEALVLRLPVVGLSAIYTKAGATVSFECDYHELGRQAGEVACRILTGEDPALITPGPPQTTRVSINLPVAQRLGLSFSPAELKLVDEVVGE